RLVTDWAFEMELHTVLYRIDDEGAVLNLDRNALRSLNVAFTRDERLDLREPWHLDRPRHEERRDGLVDRPAQPARVPVGDPRDEPARVRSVSQRNRLGFGLLALTQVNDVDLLTLLHRKHGLDELGRIVANGLAGELDDDVVGLEPRFVGWGAGQNAADHDAA